MANAKKNENPAPMTASSTSPYDMEEAWETGGAQVDGWWSPPADKEVSIKGIVTDFIDSDRSDKLQSDSIILELTEDTPFVKDANEKGADGKGIMRTGKAGEMVAIPIWTQLEGVYERKCGFFIHVVRGPKRAIGKGRSFYDVKFQSSKAKVKDIAVRTPIAKSAGDDKPVAFETN